MTVTQLRLTHPRLRYTSFDMVEDSGSVDIRHTFLLEPNIEFHSSVRIPLAGKLDKEKVAPYAFQLGIVEAISYWKSACPGEFIIDAGYISPEQIRFWYDLFMHGLGEFFYRNSIDFTGPDFLRIAVGSNVQDTPIQTVSLDRFTHADLVLVGGGKDSALTAGILKQSDRTLQTMVVNPTEAALKSIQTAGLPAPLIVTRSMDPLLLQLNAQGYLNGHTPFSAYLAFLGSTVAAIHGCERVIVSNERSANEGNVMYRGLEINHQYSKSFRFESAFREYCDMSFDDPAVYFSLLRPFNDVQIARLFSGFPEFFSSFRSCNVGSKKGVWCGACPKCAFTYLVLSPFLSYEVMMRIFGSDYFQNETILQYIAELTGLRPVKPFECVGTRDESKYALLLYMEKCIRESREIPEGLLKIKSDLHISNDDAVFLKEKVFDEWGDTFNLPDEYISLLRHVWDAHMDTLKN